MAKEKRHLSKRAKRNLIIVGSILLAGTVAITLTITLQPKAVYDFSYSKTLYEKERIDDAPQNVDLPFSLKTGVEVFDPIYNGNVVDLSVGTTSVFVVDAPAQGRYSLRMNAFVRGTGMENASFDVKVNEDETVTKSLVRSLWRNKTDVFDIDSNGNDVMPMQIKVDEYQNEYVRDYLNESALPLSFSLKQGANTVSLSISDGNLYLASLNLVSVKKVISYEEYQAEHSGIQPVKDISLKRIEAETPYRKNDNGISYSVSKNVNTTPYDTYKLKLNTMVIGKSDTAQSVTYEIVAPSSGLYSLGANYKNDIANRTAYCRFAIDGEVPFGELYHYPLKPNGDFSVNMFGDSYGKSYEFCLSEGKHYLTMTIDGTVYASINASIKDISSKISSLYLQLRTLSVQDGDTNREWKPSEDYPGVVESLTEYSSTIKKLYEEAKNRNGSSLLNEGNVYLKNAYESLNALLKNPQYLPNNNADLAEGSGSISQNLVSASSFFAEGNITFDCFILSGAGDAKAYEQKSGMFAFGQSILNFFGSFGNTSTRQVTSDTLEVWVARPNLYIDLMQSLCDSTFTKETGKKVVFQRISDEGKIIMSNAAGSSPDAVFGISNWLPYELGIRGLTKNLTQFPDYYKVINDFAPGSLIPLVADGIGLGLPETQDFYVTFYRKDLLGGLGLSPSDFNTWTDVINLLPTLQRKGMNFYIPLSSSTSSKSLMTTAPFIQQMGGDLFKYNDDNSISTSIDDEKGIEAIKMMTNFYLLYGMQLQVNNFFNEFRNGSLPIGVSTLETYQKLEYAAPELVGKWDIALSPGMKGSSGEVERWQAGSATSCILMNNNSDMDASWSLLKWWMSSEIQAEFAGDLRKMYGAEYIYNSANLKAFENSTISSSHKATILSQWDWMREYPRVPGWYMVERELSNDWNRVVLNGVNVRTSTDTSVSLINKEIKRKMTEFGYLDQNGKALKKFTFTTLDMIKEWQGRAE